MLDAKFLEDPSCCQVQRATLCRIYTIDNCLSLLLQGGLLKVVGRLCSRVLLAGLAVGLGGSALFRIEAGNLFLGLVDVLHKLA